MMINKITAMAFSPNGSTKKVVNLVAHRIAERINVSVTEDDFTLPEKRTEHREFSDKDLVVIGVPTYAGRIPNKILPFVQENFSGNGAVAIPVVTFGNRSFDESLKELCLEMDQNGFEIPGAAGIVCRHVFSDKLATGRPDENDVEDILTFADQCADKLMDEAYLDFYKESPVGPYYKPLGIDGKPTVFLKAKPKTVEENCRKCGICAKNCPMGSIDAANPSIVLGICIKCQSCVKKCPTGAKYFDDEAFLSHVAMLEANYERRTESMFLIK